MNQKDMRFNFSTFIISLISLVLLNSCSNKKVSVDIYDWETSDLMFTTYFYEVKNHSSEDLHISFVVEATDNRGRVYSDEEWLDVSAGKTRKSSTFFSTNGQSIQELKVVDTKTRVTFF